MEGSMSQKDELSYLQLGRRKSHLADFAVN